MDCSTGSSFLWRSNWLTRFWSPLFELLASSFIHGRTVPGLSLKELLSLLSRHLLSLKLSLDREGEKHKRGTGFAGTQSLIEDVVHAFMDGYRTHEQLYRSFVDPLLSSCFDIMAGIQSASDKTLTTISSALQFIAKEGICADYFVNNYGVGSSGDTFTPGNRHAVHLFSAAYSVLYCFSRDITLREMFITPNTRAHGPSVHLEALLKILHDSSAYYLNPEFNATSFDANKLLYLRETISAQCRYEVRTMALVLLAQSSPLRQSGVILSHLFSILAQVMIATQNEISSDQVFHHALPSLTTDVTSLSIHALKVINAVLRDEGTHGHFPGPPVDYQNAYGQIFALDPNNGASGFQLALDLGIVAWSFKMVHLVPVYKRAERIVFSIFFQTLFSFASPPDLFRMSQLAKFRYALEGALSAITTPSILEKVVGRIIALGHQIRHLVESWDTQHASNPFIDLIRNIASAKIAEWRVSLITLPAEADRIESMLDEAVIPLSF